MSFWRRIAIRPEEGARGEIPSVGIFEKNCIECESDSDASSVSEQKAAVATRQKCTGGSACIRIASLDSMCLSNLSLLTETSVCCGPSDSALSVARVLRGE